MLQKLFIKNHAVNIVEVDIQLKKGSKLMQKKVRKRLDLSIRIHLQPAVEKEIEKLKKNRDTLKKQKNIDENCFVRPAVITIKKTNR